MKVIMQSPAAYTLPVKLLTSTNDFLMTGPYVPQNCLLANNHTQTRAARRMRSLPHTSIMSFIRGSACCVVDGCKCHFYACFPISS